MSLISYISLYLSHRYILFKCTGSAHVDLSGLPHIMFVCIMCRDILSNHVPASAHRDVVADRRLNEIEFTISYCLDLQPNQLPLNHSPTLPLQRLDHTLWPCTQPPAPRLLHELHSRLYLGTGRELPFYKVAAQKVSGGGNTLD